ncbi:Transglutaminase-like superfamily protein [Phycisphaerae bacterium RAS1]|nr:Transglutaminase-like superfamily protein [Phycisphaerae bacterium RAS1]
MQTLPVRRALFPLAALVILALAAVARADDDIKSGIAAAGDAKKHDSDVVIVLDETHVTVRPNGIGEARTRRVAKVLRDRGARGEAVQRFEFDPKTNELTLNAARVYRADGKVEELAVHDAVEQPAADRTIFWGSRQRLLSVGRLEVGDAIETIVTKTGFNVAYLEEGNGEQGTGNSDAATALEPPMPGHWYDEVTWSAGVPIVEKRYVVRMPKDKRLQYEIYNGSLRVAVALDGEHMVYTFEKRDIPAWKGEPKSTARSDIDTKLVLATLPDWESKSRWFHEKNEAGFAVDDAIRAKVAEIIKSCKSDEEKYTALNHWVAENIRYIGTSRGACEGYTTHPAIETFHDRGGVCKDKAGLLVAMLRVAGFDSYIVMTQAGSAVAPVPADQFNHAVTSIRNTDGSFTMLDPTWMPKSRDNWSTAESLQNIVYGTPEGIGLSITPASGPEQNVVKYESSCAALPDGRLEGRVRLTATGTPETQLRRRLAGRVPDERRQVIEEGFTRLAASVRLANLRVMDPVDFSRPFELESEFTADGYVVGGGAKAYLKLPMMQRVLADVLCGDWEGTTTLEQRKQPLRMRATRRLEIRETVKLPEGWKAIELPKARTLDGPSASLAFTIERTNGSIEYRCDVDVKKHIVPPAEYANFREVMQALDEIAGRAVVCEREVASAQR